MQSTLNFLILLHISRLCHSAPGWLDDDDLFASSISSQLDANVGNLQPFSSLDDIYDFNLESFDGLNLGETDSDSNMFPPFDESSQDLQELDPYQEIFAGGEHACSSNDLLPPSRLRPRIDWCDQKPDPAILDLKIPTLDNLPRKKLPSPSPLNPPSWQPLDGILFDRPEIENPEVCPKSYRGWYYIPVCGIRLGDQGRYAPTALNNLRGWTVTDATIWKLGFEVCFNPKQIWCCEKYYSDTRMAYPCETVMDAWAWADSFENQLGGGGFYPIPNGAE